MTASPNGVARLNTPSKGMVELVVGDSTFTLRRVNLGELERFMLSLAELQEAMVARQDALGPDAGQVARIRATFDDRRGLLGWWGEVLAELCPGATLPEDPSSLDAELSSGELAAEVVAMWQGSPRAPGA